MSQTQPHAGDGDALALLDFSSLLDGAARLRPGRIAIHDVGGGGARALTFASLDLRTTAMAQAWRDLGLMAGERIALVGSASPGCILALFGALRAGIDVALAPPHWSGEDLAQFAMATGAAALCGEAQCGGVDIGEAMYQAAAAAERVRLIACIGTGSLDGAVALDPFLLDTRRKPDADLMEHAAHARLITRDATGYYLVHRQRTLVAAALDFITHAPIGTHLPLVTTILPASFAGLVAGPIAALAAGAPLILHGPFEPARLQEEIARLKPVHLVAPAALGSDIAASPLIGTGGLASLVLLARHMELPAEGTQDAPLPLQIPVIDLYAIGETTAVAEPRRIDGTCPAPLALAHMLNLDGRDIIAAQRRMRDGAAAAIEGVAVSGSGDGEHE